MEDVTNVFENLLDAWPLLSARIRASFSVLAGLALWIAASPTSAHAAEVLGAQLDEAVARSVRVALRDGAGVKVEGKADGKAISLDEAGRAPTRRFQPLVIYVDVSNQTAETLERLKGNVAALAKMRLESEAKLGAWHFRSEPPLVIVADSLGNAVELRGVESIEKTLKPQQDAWKPATEWAASAMGPLLTRTLSAYASQDKAWAIIFSSLCGSESDSALEFGAWKNPTRVLTWDQGLDKRCEKGRATWASGLAAKADQIKVVKLFDAASEAAARQALTEEPHNPDEVVTLHGMTWAGGPITVELSVAGASPYTLSVSKEELPQAWLDAAHMEQSRKTKVMLMIALVSLIVVAGGFAAMRARSSATEMAKWEAIGEAEEMASGLDPDAWNATIFQLTGAMPVLKEVREAAQLGPAAKKEEKPAAPKVEEKRAAPVVEPAAPAQAGPSTGMTVTMPVLDDGTGYEADLPCEVGVLLNGKPVARKTKKFRKVFSIGRATDNRVVIQKDDTVHRYHVVVRPALQGKEWWVEVSPTATNRTNLNGKDLRPGARYRLPQRFRLQLGEGTEIRGRIEAGSDSEG
jgi:hypothetical protein